MCVYDNQTIVLPDAFCDSETRPESSAECALPCPGMEAAQNKIIEPKLSRKSVRPGSSVNREYGFDGSGSGQAEDGSGNFESGSGFFETGSDLLESGSGNDVDDDVKNGEESSLDGSDDNRVDKNDGKINIFVYPFYTFCSSDFAFPH